MKNTCKCCSPRDSKHISKNMPCVSFNSVHRLGSWKVSQDCSGKFIHKINSGGKQHKPSCPTDWEGKSLQSNCTVKVKWKCNSILHPRARIYAICFVSSWGVYLHSSTHHTVCVPWSCGTCHTWGVDWRTTFNKALGCPQKRYQNPKSGGSQ